MLFKVLYAQIFDITYQMLQQTKPTPAQHASSLLCHTHQLYLPTQQAMLDLSQQIFNIKLELLYSQNQNAQQANRLKEKDQLQLLLQLQIDKLQFDCTNFKARIASLETDCKQDELANQQLNIKQAQQVKWYGQKIKKMEEDALSLKQRQNEKVKKMVEQADKRYDELLQKCNKLNSEHQQLQKDADDMRQLCEKLGAQEKSIIQAIVQKLKGNGQQEIGQASWFDILCKAGSKLSQMKMQLAGIEELVKNKQGRPDYEEYQLDERISNIFSSDNKLIQKWKNKLESYDLKLNSILKQLNYKQEACYDEKIWQLLQIQITLLKSHELSLIEKVKQLQTRKCQECQAKASQIVAFQQQINNLNTNLGHLQKASQQQLQDHIQHIQKLQQQQKSTTTQLSQQIQKLQLSQTNSLQSITQLKALNNTIEKQNIKMKAQNTELKKQKQKLQLETNSLKSKYQQIAKQKEAVIKGNKKESENMQKQMCRLKKQIQQKQMEVRQLKSTQAMLKENEKVYKQNLQEQRQKELLGNKNVNEKVEQVQKQADRLKQRLSQKAKNLQQIQNKYYALQQSLLSKQKQLQRLTTSLKQKDTQIQKNLQRNVQVVNDFSLKEAQICSLISTKFKQNVKKIEEAFAIIEKNQCLSSVKQSNNSQNTCCGISSLINMENVNVDWVNKALQQCQNNRKVKTKFVTRLTNNFFSLQRCLEENKNMVLICLTNSNFIFCIYKSDQTNKNNQCYPVVIFSAFNKLRYPDSSQIYKKTIFKFIKVKDDGELILGYNQIIFKKNQVALSYNNTKSYFNKIDKEKLFGIKENQNSFTLKEIQIHQLQSQ